jgi:transcriptional regulator with XRE-family HTH domain
MSNFGRNIKKIRTFKRLTQSGFAEIYNLTRASIGAYEEGRAEPKIDTIIEIANHFSISMDKLISNELTINDITHFDLSNEVTAINRLKNKPAIDIPFVPKNRINDYIENLFNSEYIKSLPVIALPVLHKDIHRAFENPGPEMEQTIGGLHIDDILICKFISKEIWDKLIINEIIVIFTRENFLVGRNRGLFGNSLNLTFDNKNFNAREISTESILEIWTLCGVFTTHLLNNVILDDQLESITMKLSQISSKIESLSS